MRKGKRENKQKVIASQRGHEQKPLSGYEAILQAEENFKVNYFLVMVDMTMTSLTCRFEELKSFKSIFGFLMSSENLKALDGSQLKDYCTKFTGTFSRRAFI
jgi:hypothetical protein